MITTTILLNPSLTSWTLFGHLFDGFLALFDQVVLYSHSFRVFIASLAVMKLAVTVRTGSEFTFGAGHYGALAIVDLSAITEGGDAPSETRNRF